MQGEADYGNPQQITMKNGRPATQDFKCGTKMFKIGKAHSSYLYIFYISQNAKRSKVFLQFCLKEEINYGE